MSYNHEGPDEHKGRKHDSSFDVCRAVQLTPSGRGAIATIRVEGPTARQVVKDHLRRPAGQPITHWPRDRAIRAIWQHAEGTSEEVIVISPDRDAVEVHCHGGTSTTGSILQSLQQLGCEIWNWSDWVLRQDDTATRREASLQLPSALTELTALCLLDQCQGALDRELTSLANPSADILDRLQALAATYTLGQHLAKPWRIVLGGPPNAGKSSLINRLLGYDRALVFDLPGTTRDVLRGESAIAGWPTELVDTPGWLASAEGSDQMGVELGQSAWNSADYRILVLDATQPASEKIASHTRCHLIAWNKIDLPGALQLPTASGEIPICAVSALTGAGCEQLLNEIGNLLPAAPPRGAAVLVTARQHEWIVAAIRCSTMDDRQGLQRALWQCQHGPLVGNS